MAPAAPEAAVWVALPVLDRSKLPVAYNIPPTPHCNLVVLLVERRMPPPPPLRLPLWLLLGRQELPLLGLVSCNIPPRPLCNPAVLSAESSADPSSCNTPPKPSCSQAGWQVEAAEGVLLEVAGQVKRRGAGRGREQEAVGSSVSSKRPRQRWGLWGLEVLWGRGGLVAAPTGDTCCPNLVGGIGVEVGVAEDLDCNVEELLGVRAGKDLG